jgi:hypothetical protein
VTSEFVSVRIRSESIPSGDGRGVFDLFVSFSFSSRSGSSSGSGQGKHKHMRDLFCGYPRHDWSGQSASRVSWRWRWLRQEAVSHGPRLHPADVQEYDRTSCFILRVLEFYRFRIVTKITVLAKIGNHFKKKKKR